jgi:hypothetical protein
MIVGPIDHAPEFTTSATKKSPTKTPIEADIAEKWLKPFH